MCLLNKKALNLEDVAYFANSLNEIQCNGKKLISKTFWTNCSLRRFFKVCIQSTTPFV